MISGATCRRIVSTPAFRQNFLGGIIAIVIKILRGEKEPRLAEMSKEENMYIDTYMIYIYIYKRDEVEFRSLHKGLRERGGCWSVDKLVECHNWNGRVRLPQDNGLVRVQIINAALSLSLSRFSFAPTIPDSFNPLPPLPARRRAAFEEKISFVGPPARPLENGDEFEGFEW